MGVGSDFSVTAKSTCRRASGQPEQWETRLWDERLEQVELSFRHPAAQNSEHSGRVRKNEGGSSAGGAKEFDPKHRKGLYL